jgi:hypothetical protein
MRIVQLRRRHVSAVLAHLSRMKVIQPTVHDAPMGTSFQGPSHQLKAQPAYQCADPRWSHFSGHAKGRLNTWLTFTSALPARLVQFPVGGQHVHGVFS